MSASRLPRAALLAAACLAGRAQAVGLGDITLHSRIGEPIRAELPITVGEGDQLDVACFTLAPLPGSDLPVITAARTRLVRVGQNYRLIITGGKPIDEPLFVINIRASCGIDLQRDYVLLPAPPQLAATPTLPESDASDDVPARAPARKAARPRPAESFDTLEAVPPPAPKPRTPRAAPASLPRDHLAKLDKGRDRIVLGSAPESQPPSGANRTLDELNAVGERMLKMETTLHLLNEEIAKIDSALALKAESGAVREKLQNIAPRPAAPLQPPPPPAAAPASRLDDWIELLIGILLGGAVSATVAHFVSRRQASASQPFDAPPPRIARPRQRAD